MNGIIINVDPVIFRIGFLELRWYGLIIILAVLAAVLITAHRLKKKGIPTKDISSVAPWMLIGAIVGARLFHVADHWAHYMSYPAQVFYLQQGGLAIWGGLIGAAIGTIICARIKHIPLGRLGDALAPGLLVAFIIGRIACIINGDAYGGVTSLPWGFIYIHPGASIPPHLFGIPTHPYPLYEIIWNAVTLLVIGKLGYRFEKDGMLFLSYVSLYSLGRLVLTFVRQENITLWGLQQAQVISMFALVSSVIAIIYLARKRVPLENEPEPMTSA
ncbi:MAG: prolipoprotein diacylglyceryl transferase [Dehalococcoidales bacterium]|nr:prolipoprotein diacylglyceryl transferase [Dehalococcoidales bacterium]